MEQEKRIVELGEKILTEGMKNREGAGKKMRCVRVVRKRKRREVSRPSYHFIWR